MGAREKKLAAITLAVLVLGLLFDQVVMPLWASWNETRDQLAQLEEALETNRRLAERADEQVALSDRLVAALPRADDPSLGPALLTLLQETAQTAGLSLPGTGRQGRRELEHPGLFEVWVPVELRAVSFQGMVKFLRLLRESPSLVKVTSLRLIAERTGRVNASLNLAALARADFPEEATR